jgi:hypothetical protein
MLRVALLIINSAIISTALLSSPADAVVACGGATVPSDIALASGGCSVGPVTFGDNPVLNTVSGGGLMVLGNFTPISSGHEYGLTLNYTALAQAPNGTGEPFAGNTTGTGHALVSEILSNGTKMSPASPRLTMVFTPITTLFILMDQADFVSPGGGTSTMSALNNAFSVGVIPLPAAFPLFASGLAALGLLGRRKKRKALASSCAAA